ncbi:MAG: BatA domain-containing protein [Polaribacter sp.]
MQFKNPEIFYFLAFLIIPILVHLFQLQKFVKIPFTNVAFLKKLVQQTRKSSRIKKWLILANRLLLLLAILFAFSQPYFSNKKADKKLHNFIYLDNSLSTNSKGERGDLLKITAQEIIENTSDNHLYSLQTNSNFYANITKLELKNILLNLENTSDKLDLSTIFLKINKDRLNKTKTLSKNILISDFQNIYKNKFTNVTPAFSAIKLNQTVKSNISIDSVFINTTNSGNSKVNVVVKNQGVAKKNVPISIFNRNQLISKQSFSIEKNSQKNIEFNIQNTSNFTGKINITFSDTFSFDNSFYFTLKNSKKIAVLGIGNNLDFLSKIYNKEEFNFTNSSLLNVNYSSIDKQDLIIISELKNIPEILSKKLVSFSKNGGNLVVIPNDNSELVSYNTFLNQLSIGNFKPKIKDTLKITSINYSHPLFTNVFSKKVKNFQYPEIYSYFPTSSRNGSTILSFENNQAFIQQIQKKQSSVYLVSSALNRNNSNFINSPIIVPIFYNFGKLSFKHAKLYYRIQQENKIDVNVTIKKDEVLALSKDETNFIPLQQTYQNKVTINTKEQPKKSGIYHILVKNDTLESVAFNYLKEESNLNFLDMNALKKVNQNIEISNSVADTFTSINKKNEVQWLWKWFLAVAIVSLLLEICILKFYKP